MTGFNLPPGCSVNDLPGNRPSELALEAAEERAIEELAKHCHDAFDYEFAVKAGVAALQATREVITNELADRIADALSVVQTPPTLKACPKCRGLGVDRQHMAVDGTPTACPECEGYGMAVSILRTQAE